MEENKHTFDLGESWDALAEASVTMSAVEGLDIRASNEELRLNLNNIQASLDICKVTLSKMIEERKELDPKPEFGSAAAVMKAETDYYIIEVVRKIEILENAMKRLEAQGLDN